MLLSALSAHSQSPANPSAADPFLKSNQPIAAALAAINANSQPNTAETLPPEALLRIEVFSLPLEEARTLTRQHPKSPDLYGRLGEELDKEKPTVKLERLMVLRVRGGQRSKLEEVEEYAYPTEFEPPRIPQSIGIGQPAPATTTVSIPPAAPPKVPPTTPAPSQAPGAKGEAGPAGAPADTSTKPAGPASTGHVPPPWPYAPTDPHSFEFRITGWTSEVEITIADDGETVDLNMAHQFVRLCSLESQSPNGEVMLPNFETSKMATQVLTKFGKPTLAGSFSPPVAVGVEGGNTVPTTRLFFITATKPR